MKKYIMALDQGTTSCRCIIYDRKGQVISVAQKEFTQIFPQPGWVEHDAMEIWSTQMGVAQEALLKINCTYKNIDAIVLGCTHYPHIKDLISKYFIDAALLDGGNGVARETKRQLERMNMLGTGNAPIVEIINSMDM